MEEEKNMSFLQHLEELRWRLVRSAAVIIVLAIVIWWFQDWIMTHVFLSMSKPDFFTFHVFCKYMHFMCVDEIPINFQSTTMGGQFSYALWMSFLGGVVIGFPFIFYQLWSFVKPGLKQNEKQMVKGIVFYVSLLFFLGILFGYFIVAPMSVQFFGTYQITKEIKNDFTINSYMSTILSTVFYSGLFFLLPILAYLLGKLGIVSSGFLIKYRKHSIVVVLILAAIITPPDMISQVIVSIPILLLYEIGIFVVKRVEKVRLKEESNG
nr:twin-arginine translocase subunit TatC [uncultured Fluviicola sp.]